MSLAIVILAAGASSRMRGRDKLFEVVEGTPILTRLVQFAQGCGAVYVTLPDPNHPRHDLLTDTQALSVYVPDAADGMSASIKRACVAVSETSAKGMMILTGDLPDLTEAHFAQICTEWVKDETRYIQAKDRDGKPGHPVIIPESGWNKKRSWHRRYCWLDGTGHVSGVRCLAGQYRIFPLPIGCDGRKTGHPNPTWWPCQGR